jgi:23S rRNA (cytosine1962-C5)-methyltransferase
MTRPAKPDSFARMTDIAETEETGAAAGAKLPVVKIMPGRHKRVRAGHPWVFSNEVEMSPDAKTLEPGMPVTLVDASGAAIGTALFNPKPLISARMLTPEPDAVLNTDWIAARFERALALRDRLFGAPYYRLIHAEADGMPGLIVDRYGDICALQLNTAGMDRLADGIVTALRRTISPKGIVIQRDGAARRLEGLEGAPVQILGDVPSPAPVMENGVRFLADLAGGQKTGWFFDHRENRARAAQLSGGRSVLDCYCYLGGFGLQAAAAGASSVLCVDRSQPALDLSRQAADEAGFGDRVKFEKSEAFGALEVLVGEGRRFGVVVADPPAFVKTKKDLKPGARGYRKLARLAATLVEPDGILVIASCSHHVDPMLFSDQVRRGLLDAGRTGRILHAGGAGPDHPVHPALPESAYLKCLFLQLD